MKLIKNCKWCNKKISIDTAKTEGFKWDYCSLNCNEEFYLKYRSGFKPRKYEKLPYIKLSDKLIEELLTKNNIINNI